MKGYAFADRPPSDVELERLRLLMSLFCDGALGLQTLKNGETRPHWRQLERALATAIGGRAPENKGVIDIVVQRENQPAYGIDVKSSQLLADGRVLLEVTNAAKQLHAGITAGGLDFATADPSAVGSVLTAVVHGWHAGLGGVYGASLEDSAYVTFVHDKKWLEWEVFWFPLRLPDPSTLEWTRRLGGTIVADTGGRPVMEWYPNSGGQLKYYPRSDAARWRSGPFVLAQPPPQTLEAIASEAWGEKWPALSSEELPL